VHPGAVLSQVDELEEVLVETCPFAVLSEKRLMGAGGAGGDYHPVQHEFLDPVPYGGEPIL